MSKAYIYKKEKDGKTYVCSSFNNSKEFVTIFHESAGLFNQYWQQGQVEYKETSSDITSTINTANPFQSKCDVGHIIDNVWRPGLVINIPEALKVDKTEKNRAKKDLKILIEKLHEILMFVEPDENGFKVHSHKIRELLILACTEVENSWIQYFRLAGISTDRLSTNDYVKLCKELYLKEYNVTFTSHPISIDLSPFKDWDVEKPTQSLEWYNSYNKTKHNKSASFSEATLLHSFNAIAANIIMFCIRFGPFELIESNDICSNLINEHFTIEIIEPDLSSFYVPLIESVRTATGAFSAPLSSRFEAKWVIDSFTIE